MKYFSFLFLAGLILLACDGDDDTGLPYMIYSGVPMQEILDRGFTPYEIYQNGGDISQILAVDRRHYLTLLESGVPIQALSDAGVLLDEFKSAGKTDAELEAADVIGTLTDLEGNTYKWVKIGNQTWMSENLRTRKYGNGDDMNTVDYVDAPHNLGKMYSIFGVLKGHVSSANPSGVQGICPNGWHVPSREEWLQLRNTLGPQNSLKVKSEEGAMWAYYTTDAIGNNMSGLSVYPAGYRAYRYLGSGTGPVDHYEVGNLAAFWTTEPLENYGGVTVGTAMSFDYRLYYDFVVQAGWDVRYYLCVRCINDN